MRIDFRRVQRGMTYAALLRERDHGIERWERTSRPFTTRYAGLCGDCGFPIEVDEPAAQGRLLTSSGVVHLKCPPWETRYEALFQIDGDLVLTVMLEPNDQRCYICDAPLVPHSLLIANPSPYSVWNDDVSAVLPWRRAAYVCERHRVHVRHALSLEDRRASALGFKPSITDRGLPSRL